MAIRILKEFVEDSRVATLRINNADSCIYEVYVRDNLDNYTTTVSFTNQTLGENYASDFVKTKRVLL